MFLFKPRKKFQKFFNIFSFKFITIDPSNHNILSKINLQLTAYSKTTGNIVKKDVFSKNLDFTRKEALLYILQGFVYLKLVFIFLYD